MSELRLEGELLKFVNYLKGFQPCWIVLENVFLLYKKKKSDKDITSIINVSNCQIKRDKKDIKIIFPSKDKFKFRFKDPAKLELWYDALMKANSMKYYGPPPQCRFVSSQIQNEQEQQKTNPKIQQQEQQQKLVWEKQQENNLLSAQQEITRTEEQQKMNLQLEKEWDQVNLKQSEIDQLMENYRPSIRKTIQIKQDQNIQQQLAQVWSLYDEFQQSLEKAPQELKGISEKSSSYLLDLLDLCHTLKLCLAECLAFIQDKYSQQVNNIQDLQEQEHLSENYLSDEESSLETSSQEEDIQDVIKQQLAKRRSTITQQRISLPQQKDQKQQQTIWEDIRNTITQDFASVNVPISFVEPLTFLQRMTEDLEYANLIQNASNQQQEELRNAYIAVFAATPYNSAQYRNFKPMNPVLGETFEICENQLKVVCEQVSASPSISAINAQTDFFNYWSQISFKNSFRGQYLEIYPQGKANLLLKSFGEEFEWNRLTISVFNLITGIPFCDFHGQINVINKTNGWQSTITFYKKEMQQRVRNYEISGQLTDSQGQIRGKYSGKWDQYIYYTPQDSSPILIWNRRVMPPNCESYYYFTNFTFQLNAINQEQEKNIPSTDSRRRLDIRALENQDESKALTEREKIVWKEKEAKKQIGSKKYQPLWFDLQGEEYIFNNKYWEERSKSFPDIKRDFF